MHIRQTILRPLLRSLAALTLVLFVAAQAACFVHCHFGGGHGDAAKPSCHGAPMAKTHDGHTPAAPTVPASSIPCATLKSLLAGGDAYTLVLPVLQPIDFVLLSFDALNASEHESNLAHSRQARPREWVFTPEVCLGPAFRSLAPPVSA